MAYSEPLRNIGKPPHLYLIMTQDRYNVDILGDRRGEYVASTAQQNKQNIESVLAKFSLRYSNEVSNEPTIAGIGRKSPAENGASENVDEIQR